jgi:hypothetical protein
MIRIRNEPASHQPARRRKRRRDNLLAMTCSSSSSSSSSERERERERDKERERERERERIREKERETREGREICVKKNKYKCLSTTKVELTIGMMHCINWNILSPFSRAPISLIPCCSN